MRFAVDEQEAQEIRKNVTRRRGPRDEEDDTEITLGMRSLLGIFFGLVLICGVFFGLGYSVGRGSAHLPTLADGTPAPALPGTPIAKPSADQSLTAAQPAAAAPQTTTDAAGSQPLAESAPPAAQTTAPSAGPPALTPAVQTEPAAAQPAPAHSAYPAIQPKPIAVSTQPASATAVPATNPMGTYMVQIAAVRVQEDASVLVTALQRHGYQVVVRHAPQDALLHVQIGPFATRTQAMEMRSRLLADGYNAVIK